MKKKRRQRVVIDFCAECGTLLPPGVTLCQVCGCENQWIPVGELHMDDFTYDEILSDPDFENWHSA